MKTTCQGKRLTSGNWLCKTRFMTSEQLQLLLNRRISEQRNHREAEAMNRTKVVMQGDIRIIFAEAGLIRGSHRFEGFTVSLRMDELPRLIERAIKNKSHRCATGGVIVEVTRVIVGK